MHLLYQCDYCKQYYDSSLPSHKFTISNDKGENVAAAILCSKCANKLVKTITAGARSEDIPGQMELDLR